ncbi:MAG: nucleotidyltransferase domain-containing protein [Verrucomicrobia bacterium]|nr:nucleotidyltransferase domain-containing protein [Verrucomicrobiota bacterium]MDA1067503.1 nucleotidyltransferase domain-containing protein [Verrucomicrobiota bacterium]
MNSRMVSAIKALELKEQTLHEIGVLKIGIFGSVAKGEDNKNSDIDILVKFTPECHRYQNFNQLCDLLDDTFGERYDLVTEEGLSPYFGGKVLEEVVYVPLAS